MGYVAVWKVLEEMITDFRRKRLAVPSQVMEDLKSAKTLLKILKAEPSRGEHIQKIDVYLGNVESYLVSQGQKTFGIEYVDEWMEKVDNASREIYDEEEKESRFIPGVPRHQKWIRVASSNDLPTEKVRAIADEMKLSHMAQKDGSLLVYGEDETIKNFVKKMASKYAAKAEKYRKKVHNG
jgi:hypothetical protein